jgi:translation initiation factor 2B subunit (eIF-2B alpha/beta/delta family)
MRFGGPPAAGRAAAGGRAIWEEVRMDFEEALARLRSDRDSGAGEVVLDAADALVQGIGPFEAEDPAAALARVREVARAVVAAQPAMGPVHALAAAVVGAAAEAAAAGGSGGEAPSGPALGVRLAALRAAAAFLRRSAEACSAAADHAAALVPAGAKVLTVSRSSTVLDALQKAAAAGPLEVVCLEGRPRLEGRRLAMELAAQGVGVTVAADAAVAALVAGCDLVLVGADALGDGGLVNKIGTQAAALAARAFGTPCYAVLDSSKLLPVGVRLPLDDDRAPEELWADAPAGVTVWNRYFEATPLALFTGIVLEDGVHAPDGVEALRPRDAAG